MFCKCSPKRSGQRPESLPGRAFHFLWRGCGVTIFLLLLSLLLPAGVECAGPNRMVEIILDASGSMDGKFRGAETKLGAVKKAVEGMVRQTDPDLVLAARAYGSQSPRERHDCYDTRLLTTFSYGADSRQKMVLQVSGLKALGLSPISYVLGEAARDFGSGFEGDEIMVLVSDGRDTCKGDPCALATKLARERENLVVHTIGLSADSMVRQQLECIAKATGGKSYFPDDDAMLSKALNAVVNTPRGMIIRKIGDGMLRVDGAGTALHTVIKAETGENVGVVGPGPTAIRLPAGIYEVTFGTSIWKSIEVEPGVVTEVRPALLRVEHASPRGNKVVELETGDEVGVISQSKDIMELVPSEYGVYFGNAVWRISAATGARITLNPGIVSVRDASSQGHRIRTMHGEVVDTASFMAPTVPLPPGEYTIEFDDRLKPFTLKEGETVVFGRLRHGYSGPSPVR